MIWFNKDFNISEYILMGQNTLVDHLGIEFTELGDDYLKAKMPVDFRTVQPMRLLHGGASVALAETMGSVASFLYVDTSKFYCVGQSINASHIKSAKEGEFVTGIAKPLHLGKKSHVWNIEIKNENNLLVCVCRLTMAIITVK
ncbi:UNVERIFIED_CONTAM: hypothetical protein GTU68_002046 [Idotea baltica]|nr:hypothetical protein [Idotea baltica]